MSTSLTPAPSSSPFRVDKRRAPAPSPSPRRKRTRAGTPVLGVGDDARDAQDDDDDASTPAMSLPELSYAQTTLTTLGGPSSLPATDDAAVLVESGRGMRNVDIEDGEGEEARSVLFSESKAERTEPTEALDAFVHAPLDEGEDDGDDEADGDDHSAEQTGALDQGQAGAVDQAEDDAAEVDVEGEGEGDAFVPEGEADADPEQFWAESTDAVDGADASVATGAVTAGADAADAADSYASAPSAASGPSRATAAPERAPLPDRDLLGAPSLAPPDDDDLDDASSYHSGDSDEYEMAQRPVLERTAVKRDIRQLYESIPSLRRPYTDQARYRIVDRLGEVYLAYDCEREQYDNTYWQDLLDDASDGPRVALKKILVTSSPARIENELCILENLRGCRYVSQLITAFREEDQVVVVLPYHKYDDFRYFYKCMDPFKTRQYMRCLLRALKDIHMRGIVHRDVKPANFLFDYERGEGVLVDFGLAERYTPPRKPTCQHAPATIHRLHGQRTKTADTPAVEQAVYNARKRAAAGEGRVGFKQEDPRQAIKTNRAGTRGFRAPEVLLKCPDQTVSIDIWSAGIMLLSILTHKFPIFNSSDDIEALMEIAAIFGQTAMERCAMLHNRTIVCNVPAVANAPGSLRALVLRLNPHVYTPHAPHPTPAEARAHIEWVDDALDLCAALLRLDCTRRATAAQALRHAFFARYDGADGADGDLEDDAEVVPIAEAKCGNLHTIEPNGRHVAKFANVTSEMLFGQGYPMRRNDLCPEHEHWQDRLGYNPLSAAGAVPAEEYDEGDSEGAGGAYGSNDAPAGIDAIAWGVTA